MKKAREQGKEEEREKRARDSEGESDGGIMAGSRFNRLSLEEVGSQNSLRSPGGEREREMMIVYCNAEDVRSIFVHVNVHNENVL